ncbi:MULTISPECIES: phosphoglucosamine mutase [Prochlorococcus]|uniref:Phosphoglucosamine mutase n=1 Tax=Prochlorococcus marinus (strain SARG / CCMP1375 / SS120) TaxID=167539 RepID=GLMM_PROMA|nr:MULTISPECIES: phosphoglucosamine mutase [Prochlorococcus]Q7VDU7.1 RecName: Full=Phosphoglucosamine mutase [Prochlorococcus marinus subsp. marinus str. CCMP1375]AAP99317.1 Phosphomannomutase [Prochlorococcus marinus subsp. marinus str. CCMP1375]KGG11411.1 Phosphoglucosamine mutase [Prochlorococcus marinus str. LG]KGG18633.1 Phosphoglucosamine mutase [Prochlorococcus marinus str. SS2]KGG22906.1 Phosphoglucosamine mutase [Prochlorococcus marinus str. SS35]KGG32782.1 Phosphoglucosamine mutase 
MSTNTISHVGDLNDEQALSFFGTDGIRGKSQTFLTNSLVSQIGYWCNHVLLGEGPILIGQDSRASSERIASALAHGLATKNREIWLLGLCPTPAVSHLIKKYNASGGLMISASHNPPEDNGIKIFDKTGEKISLEKQIFIDNKLKRKVLIPICKDKDNCINRNDLLKDYKNSLLNTVDKESLIDIPIVLDLCWGSASSCGEKLFKALGANVISINAIPDGEKINVNCGSTHLEHIKKVVLESNAQMGFAFDGDADRMIAIDGKGRVIDGDHSLYLWGSSLQDKNMLPEQRLVTTVMSNLGLEKAWLNRGGKLTRTPVGDQHVHKAMLTNKASLGGEQSGHILSTLNDLCGDGLLAAIQLSSICNRKGILLSEWRDQSFKPYPQKLISVPIAKHITQNYLNKSEKFRLSIAEAELDLGKEGRVFIRKSGTEPLVRVMVESIDKLLVESLTTKIAKIALEEFN